jgi:hypothetical protein
MSNEFGNTSRKWRKIKVTGISGLLLKGFTVEKRSTQQDGLHIWFIYRVLRSELQLQSLWGR